MATSTLNPSTRDPDMANLAKLLAEFELAQAQFALNRALKEPCVETAIKSFKHANSQCPCVVSKMKLEDQRPEAAKPINAAKAYVDAKEAYRVANLGSFV